jgi:hypothetical protein
VNRGRKSTSLAQQCDPGGERCAPPRVRGKEPGPARPEAIGDQAGVYPDLQQLSAQRRQRRQRIAELSGIVGQHRAQSLAIASSERIERTIRRPAVQFPCHHVGVKRAVARRGNAVRGWPHHDGQRLDPEKGGHPVDTACRVLKQVLIADKQVRTRCRSNGTTGCLPVRQTHLTQDPTLIARWKAGIPYGLTA